MGKKDKSKAAPAVTLDSALYDVEARFLLSLSVEDINRSDRLFFQVEQAHWFYEDFIVEKHPHLPHFKLRDFAHELFQHCPLLSHQLQQFDELYAAFMTHRYSIPVCGVIMLNKEMDQVVLVRNWKGSSWSFPKGKINEDEASYDCAIRETIEETGFDPTPHSNPAIFLTVTGEDQKTITLFIATDVPLDTNFCPQTRKEISKVQFHPLDKLPKNAWGVTGFMPQLTRWINKQKKTKKKEKKEKKEKKDNSSTASVSTPKRRGNSSSSNAFDERNADTFAGNHDKGWSVADMFAANAKLTGAEYTYDGNPHRFGDMHPRYTRYEGLVSPLRTGHAAQANNSANLTSRTAAAFGGIAEDCEDEFTPEYFPVCFQFDMDAIHKALLGTDVC